MHKKLFLILFCCVTSSFNISPLRAAALRPRRLEAFASFSPSSISSDTLMDVLYEGVDVSFPEPPQEALFCIDPVLSVNTDVVILRFTKADIEIFGSDDYLNECVKNRNKELLYFNWLTCASLGHLRDADFIAAEDENNLLLGKLSYALEKYRFASKRPLSDEEFANREWAMAIFSAWIKGLKKSFSASLK